MQIDIAGAVDALGHLQAQIADLEAQAKALKAAIAENGAGAYEGSLFRATVSHSDRGRNGRAAQEEGRRLGEACRVEGRASRLDCPFTEAGARASKKGEVIMKPPKLVFEYRPNSTEATKLGTPYRMIKARNSSQFPMVGDWFTTRQVEAFRQAPNNEVTVIAGDLS